MTDADHDFRPPGAGPELDRALAALARRQPDLARRLAEPFTFDHVQAGQPARYLLHKAWVPLEAEPPAVPAGSGPLTLVGVGAGELLEPLLEASAGSALVAWDRDPALLTLALARPGCADWIDAGRLRFALGADLVDLDLARTVEHPLLASVYARDLAYARRGLGSTRPTALVCTGGLLVDSLGDALQRAGFDVWPLELHRISLEEIERSLARLKPAVVAAINYTNGLAELAGRHRARLLAWEIDPTTTAPRLDPSADGVDLARIFTWRKRDVSAFRAAGFSWVRHLPLASDPHLRRPLDLSSEERAHYGAPLSYVGASLVRNVEAFQRRFLELFVQAGGTAAAGGDLLQRVLAEQRRDFSSFRIPELLSREAPGLVAWCAEPGREDPSVLLGEIAAGEKRLSYVANLGRFGAQVWGDAGWRLVERHGARYRGPAGHGEELTRIYNASAINVDVGRIFQSDIVTLRTFDVLACGSFALVEHTPDLDELFAVGEELESYRDLAELVRKVEHYSDHPDRARAIAERGRAAVLERHTIDLRLATMLGAV